MGLCLFVTDPQLHQVNGHCFQPFVVFGCLVLNHKQHSIMNKNILLILLGFAITNCKKDEPGPPPEVASIVGRWRTVEYTEVKGDSILTHSIPKEQSRIIIFRFDGVMLEENGKQSCGTPGAYLLNDKLIEVKPQEPVPTTIDCTGLVGIWCPEYFKIIQRSSNEIATEWCTMKLRYVREE